MTEAVDTRELEQLQRALANLVGPGLAKFKKEATYGVAKALRTPMQTPPGPSHSPVLWASAKQRAWYFAARRKAGLPLKYSRESDPWSQRIRDRWVIQRGDDYAVLGNKAKYSVYVQSSQYQSEQHEATGWTTDEKAVERIMGDGTMRAIIESTLGKIIHDSLRRWAR